MWLLIISYLVLGAVLLYHYDCFDWSYGCLLWLVAAFTYLYPIEVASLLPYILTVCVCCVLWTCGCSALRTDQCIHDESAESNTEINSPLYVGKRTINLMVKNNFKNNRMGCENISNSEAHPQLKTESDEWIVAVKIPIRPDGPIKDKPSGNSRRFDRNRYNYLVIQSVLREIHGRENPLLSIPETNINQNYHLNHVGWYNHNPNTPLVNINGPKISGFSSSESAINVALQMTNSTVYTYFKCMVSYRPHVLFRYLLLLCCPVAYQCYSQPTAITTSITATTVMINLIAVIEINILQVGKNFDFIESILKLCRYCIALVTYIVHNIFIVFIIVGIGASIYYHVEDLHDKSKGKMLNFLIG